MPIYDQSYRSYQGALRARGRWAVMVGQELRVLLSRKMFIFLVLLGNFHLLLRVILIYLIDLSTQNPSATVFGGLSGADFLPTGAWVYFDFLRVQSPLTFLTLIYAGAGLICNDFRNNLTEIYFSKPINWLDYAAGKVMSLITIGMCLTAVPALVMGLLHIVFNPSRAALNETFSLTPAIVLFPLLFIGSFSLVILASSCLVNSAKFAGVAVFMLTLVNITLGLLISGLMQNGDYLAVAFPASLNILGEHLFNEHRYRDPVEVPWTWCAAYVATVWAAALTIICSKARRAETGR